MDSACVSDMIDVGMVEQYLSEVSDLIGWLIPKFISHY